MLRYSRSSLLKLRYWWKIPESCFGFKTSRHVQQQQQHQVKPLCSQTWNTLKSMGLLRRFRGTRKRRNTSRIFPIQSRIERILSLKISKLELLNHDDLTLTTSSIFNLTPWKTIQGEHNLNQECVKIIAL